MLITKTQTWSLAAFEAHVEGMCAQVAKWPHNHVVFWGKPSPEVIFLFFAIWKMGKIACPLSTRLPSCISALEELQAPLFNPIFPEPKPPTPWNWREEQIGTMLFTSGTTDRPKIACHTLGNHIHSALGIFSEIPLGPEDRWHLSLPLHHVAGIAILFRCYLSGASILLSPDLSYATHISLVPTQLGRLKENRFKVILLGGAPISPDHISGNIFESYGMTEMSSTIALSGRVLPHRLVKIENGEIHVQGKTLFSGYLGHPPVEGWFPTGDLGYFDAANQLHFTGRKDSLFISGGENIQPEEIEKHLKTLPQIIEAVVVGAPDPEFGKKPVAFLQPLCYTQAEVEILLKEKLPKFKIPVRLYPMPPLQGKPSRYQLSQLL